MWLSYDRSHKENRTAGSATPRVAAAAVFGVEGVVVDRPAVARQGFGAEHHRLRLLVGRDPRPNVIDDLLLSGLLVSLQHDDRPDGLRPGRIRHADDRRLSHRGM